MLSAILPGVIQALTMTVTSTSDVVDSLPGDGQCWTQSGCTLRAAIQEANANPLTGPHQIVLPAGVYRLTLGLNLAAEDQAMSGDLDVRSSVSIEGADQSNTIIDANLMDRVLEVFPGATVGISRVAIKRGNAANGAGIRNGGVLTLSNCTVAENIYGGGIFNRAKSTSVQATVRILNSRIANNNSTHGGGISNAGVMDIINSTLHRNSATLGGGIIDTVTSAITMTGSTLSENSARAGGALYITGQLSMTNSTISGNMATNGSGGALWTASKDLRIVSCTFNRNNDKLDPIHYAGAGAIHVNSGSTRIRYSIIHEPLHDKMGQLVNPDKGCTPASIALVSEGYNIERGASCKLAGNADRPWTDPLLGPLANNGGATQTCALKPGSPAIDSVAYVALYSYSMPRSDQRGIARPQYRNMGNVYIRATTPVFDIGAYELVQDVPTILF